MIVFLLSLIGTMSSGPVEAALHLITAILACLLAIVLVTSFFSPRERAWRKWRRKMRKKYGSVDL